jgi:hypothetical protein
MVSIRALSYAFVARSFLEVMARGCLLFSSHSGHEHIDKSDLYPGGRTDGSLFSLPSAFHVKVCSNGLPPTLKPFCKAHIGHV